MSSRQRAKRPRPLWRHARACPGHPRFGGVVTRKTWMAGTSPAMTRKNDTLRANIEETDVTPAQTRRQACPTEWPGDRDGASQTAAVVRRRRRAQRRDAVRSRHRAIHCRRWQAPDQRIGGMARSEEHTSELQSQSNLVCRLLLEKKKKYSHRSISYTVLCLKKRKKNKQITQ